MGHIDAHAPNWLRGPARFVDGWIVIDDALPVNALQDKDRPCAIAGVRSPEEAVRFASENGLLRYRRRAAPSREPFVDGEKWPNLREAFTDWQREAATLNHIIDLYMALRRSEIVSSEIGSVKHAMTKMLKDGIGLVGVNPEVRPDGSIVRVIVCDSLLSVAYNDLTQLIEDNREFRHCDDCGRYFLVGDPRQRFCNNTCASRTRYHRRVARQRESAAPVDGGTAAD